MASVLKGLTELSLLITFVIFIYWINAQRPARTPFKPLRVRAWVPALAVAMLICWILAQLNFPAMIQRTPQDVTNAHIQAQKECLVHLSAERFLEASDAIRNRPPSHTLGPKDDYRGPILFGFLNPIINRILFGTGVAAASFPVLVWMAVIAVQRYLSRRATGATSYTPSKGEAAQWGVLLPVINNVTYLSAAVTLSFYFYVDPARSQKCVYSSGHWYTYTCTSLTFALVISHLWVYREQSVYAARLLAGYVLYTIIYQALAITVLKNTQMYYHSAPEAQDGILAAIPVFTCLMLGLLIIQYVTFLVTEHPQSRTNKRITVDEYVEEKPRRRSARIAASPKKGTRVDADIPTSDEIPIPPSPSRTGPSANTRSAKKRRESESEVTPSTLEVPTAPVFDEVPTAPSPPAAPAFTAPPPAPGAPGGGRDALLAQIEKGSHLKHVDKSSTSKPATTTSMDPHTALMKSIEERQHKLKKTEGGVQTGPKPPSDGLAGMLEKIRVVVQPEVDDEDDDGWEHVNKDE